MPAKATVKRTRVGSSSSATKTVQVSTAKKVETRPIKFGAVTVDAAVVPVAEQKKNIARGKAALARAKTALTKPGVKLTHSKNTPLYYADPEEPGRIVRVLNGKTTVGRLTAGVFKPIK